MNPSFPRRQESKQIACQPMWQLTSLIKHKTTNTIIKRILSHSLNIPPRLDSRLRGNDEVIGIAYNSHMTINTKHGTLYLIPVTLGDDNISQVLPPFVVKIAQNLENFVVESEKSARHFLSTIKTVKPVRELTLNLLNEHTLDKDIAALLAPLLAGKDVGLMSDAGCPGIADPGA